VSAIDWTTCMNGFRREFDDREFSRRVALRESYIREIRPIINKKSELRALCPTRYTISQSGSIMTSGPQLTEEMERVHKRLDEIIERIKEYYEREMVRCFVDVARPGAEMTVAYRVRNNNGVLMVDGIDATRFYRESDTSEQLMGMLYMPDEEVMRIQGFGVRNVKDRSCASCHAESLDVYFTSQRDGRTLCQGCFDAQADKGLAKEQGQPMKTKTRHPLDAWME